MANESHYSQFGSGSDDSKDRRIIIISGIICLVAILFLPSWTKPDPLAGIPMIGKGGSLIRKIRYFGDAKGMYLKGYRKYGNGVFRIPGSGVTDNIVLAPKFLEELKRLPEDVLDAAEANFERLQGRYVTPDKDVTHVSGYIRSWITPALGRMRSEIQDEVKNALLQEIPQSSEWTEINLCQKTPRIIAMVTGRIFVGLDLCRSARYIEIATDFTKEVMVAAISLTLIPSFLRPLMAPILPQLWLTRRRIVQAEKVLGPTITSRWLQPENLNRREQVDILQLMVEASKNCGRNKKDLVIELLFLNIGAVHSTAMTITHALYWLAAKPDLIDILRKDVLQALATSDGEYSKLSLQQMTKLDSFLKEVLRCSNMVSATIHRKVKKPFTLSNGQLIPSGVTIEILSICVSSDAGNFTHPDEFDALRFYNIAQQYQDEKTGSYGPVSNTEFSAADSRTLSFGYGRHACPGRFLASAEIKMILGNILTDYEIKLPAGVLERYKNLSFGPYVGILLNSWTGSCVGLLTLNNSLSRILGKGS